MISDIFTVGNGNTAEMFTTREHPEVVTLYLFANLQQAEDFSIRTGLIPYRVPDLVAELTNARRVGVTQTVEVFADGEERILSIKDRGDEAEIEWAKHIRQLNSAD